MSDWKACKPCCNNRLPGYEGYTISGCDPELCDWCGAESDDLVFFYEPESYSPALPLPERLRRTEESLGEVA